MPMGVVTQLDSRYLTLTAAAALVGVSRPTIRRRIESGHLDGFSTLRDRRATLVLRDDVAKMTQTRRAEMPMATK